MNITFSVTNPNGMKNFQSNLEDYEAMFRTPRDKVLWRVIYRELYLTLTNIFKQKLAGISMRPQNPEYAKRKAAWVRKGKQVKKVSFGMRRVIGNKYSVLTGILHKSLVSRSFANVWEEIREGNIIAQFGIATKSNYPSSKGTLPEALYFEEKTEQEGGSFFELNASEELLIMQNLQAAIMRTTRALGVA